MRRPGPWVRTAFAPLRPQRPQTVSAAVYPSAPTDRQLAGDSSPTPPRHLRAGLSPSFSLGGIASRRPSNWLPGRSRPALQWWPLDTELDAPCGHEQPSAEGGPTEADWPTSSPFPPFVAQPSDPARGSAAAALPAVRLWNSRARS